MGRSPWFTPRDLPCIPSPYTSRAPSPLFSCPPSVMGSQEPVATMWRAGRPGLDFALNPEARRRARPNRVRLPTDCMFAVGCSPPHLTVAQLPSATGNGHLPEGDFHPSNRACSQAHGFRVKPGMTAPGVSGIISGMAYRVGASAQDARQKAHGLISHLVYPAISHDPWHPDSLLHLAPCTFALSHRRISRLRSPS